MKILRIDCDSIEQYLKPLNDLMLDTFGFSFETWHQEGHWSQDYTCYSILEDGSMIANAGVYRMEMLIAGAPKTCYQIGAVATHKTRRGEGLSRHIMNFILDQHPGETFFLCANQSVLEFYPRFGFRPLQERQPWSEHCLENPRPGMVRLDIVSDRQTIDAYLQHRSVYSNHVDCSNAAPVQWFHLLTAFADHVYAIPALKTMLVAEQDGHVLNLYDVCATAPVHFIDIAPYLAFDDTREIRFGFNPDWLGIEPQCRELDDDSTLFVRGEVNLPAAFILPMLMRT